MYVIEDKNKLRFFEGTKELTLREGFQRLNERYPSEPQEVKRVIDKLKEQYGKDLFK